MILEFQSLVTTAVELVGGGVGVWGATELVKLAPKIPVNEGQRVRIRSLAGVFSALAVLFMGFADNTLQPSDVQSVLTAILMAAGTFGASHLTHKTIKELKK